MINFVFKVKNYVVCMLTDKKVLKVLQQRMCKKNCIIDRIWAVFTYFWQQNPYFAIVLTDVFTWR